MNPVARALADLPHGYAVSDAGDHYVAVHPDLPSLQIAKDTGTTIRRVVPHLRLVKSDRVPRRT